MDNLVIDVDRRPKGPDRQVQALNRHIHAGTEAARSGEEDLHQGQGSGVRGQKSEVRVFCSSTHPSSYLLATHFFAICPKSDLCTLLLPSICLNPRFFLTSCLA